MYSHNVISWHKDEKITPEQALEFGIEFAEKWFDTFDTGSCIFSIYILFYNSIF